MQDQTLGNPSEEDFKEELALPKPAERNTTPDNEAGGSVAHAQNGPLPSVNTIVPENVLAVEAPNAIHNHEESVVSILECSVCYKTMNELNLPRRKITISCDHSPDVCLPCLSNSIATQFTSKSWDHVGCPSCNERLDYHDIKLFGDSVTFERYDNYLLEAYLNGGQFQRCRITGCSSGQQTFPEDDSYMICRECRGRTCLACDTEWHPEVTCTDNIARRAPEKAKEEAAAEAYIDANAKLCPGCKVRGEKVSGCDHMTCPRCRYQYCWLCLADYKEIQRLGNTSHRDDCRYHSNNLPGAP